MDRVERKKKQGQPQYATTGEISEADRALMQSPSGREDDQGIADRGRPENDEVQRKDIGAQPRSQITGKHDDGAGANETIDGLDDTGELTRHAAEDIGSGDGFEDRREVPVFDRR